MATASGVTFHRWDEMPKESVTGVISRRLITGDRLMLAHVYLDKGAVVPQHSHENEQITIIISGRLRFGLGAEGCSERIEQVVGPGEVLHLPGNLPHSAFALEDTLVLDLFAPPSATTGIDARR